MRATLSGTDAVRGIAAIAMVESIVPAAGPVLGAIVLAHADWRVTFWILAAATLAALPFAVRAAPRELPGMDRAVVSTYASVLADRAFIRLALSHALGMGALLTFIASAPQLMSRPEFAVLQVIGVSAFALFASQAGRISARIGTHRAVQLGAIVQVVTCGLLLATSLARDISFGLFAGFWFVFCGDTIAVPPSMSSDVTRVPGTMIGHILAIFCSPAAGPVPLLACFAHSSPQTWHAINYGQGRPRSRR